MGVSLMPQVDATWMQHSAATAEKTEFCSGTLRNGIRPCTGDWEAAVVNVRFAP